jgi:hypothetical protein
MRLRNDCDDIALRYVAMLCCLHCTLLNPERPIRFTYAKDT